MAPSRAFVVFLSIFCSAEAFLSSAQLALNGEDRLKTRDHAIITKVGLLQSLVDFVKENPQYIEQDVSASIGDFSEILISADNPNEAEKLLSFITSNIRLQNAILEIQSSNAEVNSAPLKNVAAAHFSGEQFKEGSTRLHELKSAIVTTLLKGIKFEHARQLVGQYLHTLQDFYSHSNWIELGNQVKAYDSLTNGGISIPSGLIAKPNESTCVPCPLAMEQNDICDNNLITRKITSGYHDGHDIPKPANTTKCSHGGRSDSIGVEGMKGGINKDTTARQWSPHHKLHAVAAELAIEATKTFFEDLRAAVGDNIFARFLNLQALRTLALVLDDTGSMNNEIKAVRKLSTEFVQNSNNSVINTAFVYILVPFNDPKVGPVTVSSDPDEVIQAVNSLKAHEGGDCPELGMTGLYQALAKSVQDSIIYYFSDADAKDSNLAPVVLILAKQKRVKLNFILSGECTYKRKRRSMRLPRDISQLGSQHLYQTLAAATGGQILRTKKSEVSIIVDIIGSQSSGGGAGDLMEVILLNVNSDVKDEVRGMPFLIHVDNTLRSILIVLSADENPRITLFNPLENKPLTVKVTRNLDRIQVTEVGSFEGGPLEIRVSCTGSYSLQVTGRTTLDFTYQLSVVKNTDTGETRPLLGSPVKGQTLLLSMAFTRQELIGEVTSLSLINRNGTALESFTVQRGDGIYAGSYYIMFTPSLQRFRFQVNAKTTKGKLLRRIKPTEIKIETVELGFNYRLSNSYTRIFPGISREISLKIKNTGTSQNFTLNAIDDLGYVQSLGPGHCFVAENKTVEFTLELRAPNHNSPGDTSTITVYATPTSSDQPSNYMVFYVSVTTKDTDQSPPSCKVVNQTNRCDNLFDKSNCSDVTWTSDISVFEKGQGLLTIVAKNSKLGQLAVTPFTKGLANRSVTGIYSSTCCHPSATIIAVDLFGNTGSCELSAATPILSIKVETAALTLEPGQTSKLRFSIKNLGTRGSFTLQASENSHFTVYVVPLNVILDHKQVVRGELVLTGLKETESNKTSFVVKAVPLINTANVSQVRLFEISLTVGKRERQDSSMGWNVSTDANLKPQIIQYGEKAHVKFTVRNIGFAGAFDLKASPSRDVLVEFSLNPVYLNTSAEALLELTIEAIRNRDLEETILISAVPQASGKEIKLFSQHVKIIHTTKKDGLPLLRSLVPSVKVEMTADSTVTVNITVMNVGKDGQCSFKVLCPGPLICHVTLEAVFIKENKTITEQLTVKSPADLEPGNMQVKVKAITSTMSNNRNSETSIYTLNIVIVKLGFLEDETQKKEKNTGMIKVIGIALGCVLLLILILLVVCSRMRKRGSWTVWKKKKSQKPQKTVDKPEMV